MTLLILTYRASADIGHERQLAAFIDNSKYIKEWHKPFPGLFLLESEKESSFLSQTFLDFLGNTTPFVVCRYPSGLSTGNLPQSVWEWISDHMEGRPEVIRFKKDGSEVSTREQEQ